MIETGKQDSSEILITGRTLPSPEVSWVVPPPRRVTFDKTAALMQLGGDDHVDDVPFPSKDMEEPFTVNVDAEDVYGDRDIQHSGVIDMQSSLLGTASVIQVKCILFGLDMLANAWSVFQRPFRV